MEKPRERTAKDMLHAAGMYHRMNKEELKASLEHGAGHGLSLASGLSFDFTERESGERARLNCLRNRLSNRRQCTLVCTN